MKSFEFEIEAPNGLRINCLRFAQTKVEAQRIACAQHGKGWKVVKPNQK